jgi:hypothetical protein
MLHCAEPRALRGCARAVGLECHGGEWRAHMGPKRAKPSSTADAIITLDRMLHLAHRMLQTDGTWKESMRRASVTADGRDVQASTLYASTFSMHCAQLSPRRGWPYRVNAAPPPPGDGLSVWTGWSCGIIEDNTSTNSGLDTRATPVPTNIEASLLTARSPCKTSFLLLLQQKSFLLWAPLEAVQATGEPSSNKVLHRIARRGGGKTPHAMHVNLCCFFKA